LTGAGARVRFGHRLLTSPELRWGSWALGRENQQGYEDKEWLPAPHNIVPAVIIRVLFGTATPSTENSY